MEKKSYYYRPSGTKQLVVNCFKWQYKRLRKIGIENDVQEEICCKYF